MARKIIALSNNDVVNVIWSYDEPIADCLGFEVSRQEGGFSPGGSWTPLPAWVGFKGEKNPKWIEKTTTVWPIQKFEWKDLTAERGKSYGYRVVPMTGKPGALNRQMKDALYTSSVAALTPKRGDFSVYFNRGILSTQYVAHQLGPGPSGTPNYRTLKNRIDQPNDPLRLALAGQIIEGVESLLDRASTKGGECYAALYELDDVVLVKRLLDMKKSQLHLILTNTGADDATNAASRQTLHDGGKDITDRFLPANHIGHNKFVAYADADGDPQAVLLGSTNWTDTGLCAQSNNALVVQSSALAKAYIDYWHKLKKDDAQASPLRTYDSKSTSTKINGAETTVWFSPNTPKARSRPKKGSTKTEKTPPDLAEVFNLMGKAKKAILFLVFQPGRPSIVEEAARIGNGKPNLFIRGAATDPKAVGSWDALLMHRAGEDPDRVVAATAINDQFDFWQKELLKSGPKAHAIVHSKIVVIDPMSPDCVVITGSHNLGFQASYNNDENLLIVRGHQELARAYAVNIMDVYDHYRFRYIIQKYGKSAFSGLNPSATWQKKYFDSKSRLIDEQKFWFG